MQPSTEESQNSNGTCGTAPQPCACCTALAQLRMPWMDVAMQHASHYPYAPMYPHGPNQQLNPNQAYDPGFQYQQLQGQGPAPGLAANEPASKTQFFKFPGFSKNKKKSADGQAATFAARTLSRTLKDIDANQPADANRKDGFQSSNKGSAAGSAGVKDAEDIDLDTGDAASSTDPADFNKAKEKKALKFGLRGIAVSLFGIILPSFVLSTSILSTPKRITLVTLHHPVEAIVEFLLVAAIPIVNFLVWSAISKNRANLSRWLVMALGGSVGTAFVLCLISFACLFGNHDDLADAIGSDFAMGFTWLGMITLFSAIVSAYLAHRLKMSWELQSTRLKVSMQAITGLVLALLAFAGSEYRPWCIRMAQFNAVSKDTKTRVEGLRWLRQLNPEREMRMECSDSRAAGLPGLFFPIKPSTQQQLYFTLTGTPYSFRDMNANDLSSMPDDYLSRHVVGDKIPHLDLTRSTLNGVLHANTLTSTLNWTFVVKNGSSQAQEMRAEIGLPAGAAVNGLTVWHKGEPGEADFVASGNKLEGIINQVQGGDTPAMVTDLGHGRVLLHCYPVQRDEELKVRVKMVVPLKSEKDGQASLVTPQLIASNFDLEGGEQLLRLRSKTELASNVKGLQIASNPAGESTVTGTLSSDQLESSPLLVSAKREEIGKTYAVLDKRAISLRREDEKEAERLRIQRERAKERARKEQEKAEKAELGQVVVMIDGTKTVPTQIQELRQILANKRKHENEKAQAVKIVKIKPEYTVEDISQVQAPAPKHLVVVIDGSADMKKCGKEIETALSSLPASIPTSVIIASQEDENAAKARDLKEVLPSLSNFAFAGGQDNLKAVVHAAELAGESKDSAVLWIHGPQPVINQEIYIMSPYEAQPSFYELPVVAGTDTYEFFKNHAEIGPFTQVPRNGGTIASDLTDFFSGWNPSNNSSVASIKEVQQLPADAIEPSKEEGKELIVLRAVQECNRLISSRHFHRAARIATRYGFVSEVSSALMGKNPNAGKDADLNPQLAQQAADGTPASNNSAATNNDTGTQTNNEPVGSGPDAFPTDSSKAPPLQGATNGTIGATGNDATVITGVNTAGTVRVNNLANLEALLNIIANLGELASILCGLGLLVHGFMNKTVMKLGEDIELGPAGKMVLGGILILMGLTIPGLINWFVASARDANLFS